MRFSRAWLFCFDAKKRDRINRINRMKETKTITSNGSSRNPENPVNPVQIPLPNSKKVYVPGSLHPDIRVPFREISLAPTKTISGEIEVNEPVRVYDTSGPWGDEAVALDVEQGLPPLRANWIAARGDCEEYEGRVVRPMDDGWLSETHRRNGSSKSQAPSSKEAPRNEARD